MEELVPPATLTLLFSDIEGSTRLLSQLGAAVRRSAVCPTLDHSRRGSPLARSRDRHRRGQLLRRLHVGVRRRQRGAGRSTQAQPLRTGPAAPPCGCGWDCTPVSRPCTTATTSAWTCTGPPGSPQPRMAVRSSCRRPRLSSSGNGSPDVQLKDLGWHRLKDIPEPEHIFQLVADGLDQDFPPLKSLGTPTNLPPCRLRILGRDGELAEIAAQFTSAGVRLVTLTGPGGTGKTRLAIAAADLLGSSRADGVYFVAVGDGHHRRCHVEHHRGEPRHPGRGPGSADVLRAHPFARHVVDLGQSRAADRGAPGGERAPRARAAALPSSRLLVGRCI